MVHIRQSLPSYGFRVQGVTARRCMSASASRSTPANTTATSAFSCATTSNEDQTALSEPLDVYWSSLEPGNLQCKSGFARTMGWSDSEGLACRRLLRAPRQHHRHLPSPAATGCDPHATSSEPLHHQSADRIGPPRYWAEEGEREREREREKGRGRGRGRGSDREIERSGGGGSART